MRGGKALWATEIDVLMGLLSGRFVWSVVQAPEDFTHFFCKLFEHKTIKEDINVMMQCCLIFLFLLGSKIRVRWLLKIDEYETTLFLLDTFISEILRSYSEMIVNNKNSHSSFFTFFSWKLSSTVSVNWQQKIMIKLRSV